VEFDVEAGSDGRTKAVKVTGPDGATPQVIELDWCDEGQPYGTMIEVAGAVDQLRSLIYTTSSLQRRQCSYASSTATILAGCSRLSL
jgi:hypothetical protein